ncbi:GNAT family N-acetyltransferase [Flavobacterium oncorhynchi]|uniref:GNAT family N-acetyltransferase n=1 Tax=Flavobacterium oncorhynchi TaxID=728056 RepID=UPI00351A4C03
MIVVETKRTCIKQIEQNDLEALYSICGNNELMKFVGDSKPLSIEQTQKWIEVSISNYKSKGFGMYGVFFKDNNQFIGYCGLVHSEDVNDNELIYALMKEYWGLGLATELADAIIKYGFETLKLKTIYASIDPANTASEKVLLKSGFKEVFKQNDEFGMETSYFLIQY